MFNAEFRENEVILTNIDSFDPDLIFDCGQAFRFSKDDDGNYCGIAYGKYLKVIKENESIILKGATKKDFENIWYEYFDLARDYNGMKEKIKSNELLRNMSDFGGGIRILNQEPFETLCSFIISQNNNIPRIKGIILRLCEAFGEETNGNFAFPSPEKLASLTEEDLAPIRMGFRTRYILDASKKVASGEIDLEKLKTMSYDDAKAVLMTIVGVGPKVADCTLLFSLKQFSAFPKDVWIKRAMEKLFPHGLPECVKGFEGIVQQYIFYYCLNKNL